MYGAVFGDQSVQFDGALQVFSLGNFGVVGLNSLNEAGRLDGSAHRYALLRLGCLWRRGHVVIGGRAARGWRKDRAIQFWRNDEAETAVANAKENKRIN